MQVSKKTLARWKKLKEKKDISLLAGIIGKNPSTISRILSGQQETTSDVLMKIKDFYKARRAKVALIEDDGN